MICIYDHLLRVPQHKALTRMSLCELTLRPVTLLQCIAASRGITGAPFGGLLAAEGRPCRLAMSVSSRLREEVRDLVKSLDCGAHIYQL